MDFPRGQTPVSKLISIFEPPPRVKRLSISNAPERFPNPDPKPTTEPRPSAMATLVDGTLSSQPPREADTFDYGDQSTAIASPSSHRTPPMTLNESAPTLFTSRASVGRPPTPDGYFRINIPIESYYRGYRTIESDYANSRVEGAESTELQVHLNPPKFPRSFSQTTEPIESDYARRVSTISAPSRSSIATSEATDSIEALVKEMGLRPSSIRTGDSGRLTPEAERLRSLAPISTSIWEYLSRSGAGENPYRPSSRNITGATS
ncbi:hypothetical protein BDW02DRAFT_164795 [Decorospora gaudefroyi]|uniref:Uncharacterized protein n=1 Tax=Decorospora gaudefroyi TaxID=184978 RepID=A0A6A5K4N0_9PLEO|nr:hypothetical protein BDW02DRAFT_164795 [Decorospora gaudefroyi]